ncbi:hypothetical protein MHU86_23691 [Fragilaria crotonensis]|nr:hypothetical protein MHU86_23691 [Fragilaria crotonensis]
MVTALDLRRTEYLEDGTAIERTTREWALSLTLPDGTTHAKCDVANGGKDKKTYLLVPAAYAAAIKPMIVQYKERLQPVSKREARYRDSIPDLPEVIHITSTVQSNLDYMAKMSAADIWSKAPPSVKPLPYAAAPTAPAMTQTQLDQSHSVNHNTTWPSLVKRPRPTADDSLGSTTPSKNLASKGSYLKRQMRGKSTQISVTSLEEGDRAETASTHSLTTTLRSIPTTRLTELESEMRECREMLLTTNSTAKDSADRLAKTELHLATTMATLNDLTRNVTGLQTSFNDLTRTLESMRLTLHTIASNQAPAMISHTGMNPLPIEQPLTTIAESVRQAASLDEGGSVSSDGSTYRKSPEKKKKRSYVRDDDRDEAKQDENDDCTMELFPDSCDPRTDLSENANDTQNTANLDPNVQHPHHTPSPPDTQYTNQRDPAGQEDK